jgi:hypothetical protein
MEGTGNWIQLGWTLRKPPNKKKLTLMRCKLELLNVVR